MFDLTEIIIVSFAVGVLVGAVLIYSIVLILDDYERTGRKKD